MTKNTVVLRMGFVIAFGLLAPYFSVSAKQLATVNGKSITDADLNLALSSSSVGQKTAILKDSNLRFQALMGVINQELLAQEGQKLKIDQDPEFKAQLEAQKKQLLVAHVLSQKVKVSQADAKSYYEAHKEKYSTSRVHVQHILLKTEEEAKDVLKMAKESKKDFQELAEQHSKDPNAKNNRGDIGYIRHDQLDPEFTEAAFSATKGQIVGPVQTLFGYHLIKVIDRKEGKPLEFDEVELKVKNDLQQQMVQLYMEGLKKQAKVQIDP